MKGRFRTPDWLNEHLSIPDDPFQLEESFFQALRQRMKNFSHPEPEISVMIPCWNEEANIVRTISSLSHQQSNRKIEIVFIDNNSQDRTRELLDRCGVASGFVEKQGISFARQGGLERAKGRYHLCADADTLYPGGWIDAMVAGLQDASVSCVYGEYSFLPDQGAGRIALGLYEFASELIFRIRNRNRQYVNVRGFSLAFRTADGRAVGGFNTRRPKWSDGWMAMTLADLGRVQIIKGDDARVWTGTRRLMADGGLRGAMKNRLKKELRALRERF